MTKVRKKILKKKNVSYKSIEIFLEIWNHRYLMKPVFITIKTFLMI